MNIRIPNSRGWLDRQKIAMAKQALKADPIKAERAKIRSAMSMRDNVRGEVTMAEDAVIRATDQVSRAKGVLEVYEAYSLQSLNIHPSLISGRMEVEATETLLGIAEKQLAAVKARLVTAEEAFAAAQGRFVENTAALDADGADDAEILPAVVVAPVADGARSIAVVPASVDAGVSLSRDDAIASLDAASKKGRRR